MTKPRRQTAKSQEIDRPANIGNPRMKWGSDVVAQAIANLDIPYIALVPGASYRGLHDSIVNYLGNRAPQMVVCLHEEHSVAIANGYAKVTETPMAVALHSNVGLMHAAMTIYNAWCERSPMVIFGATGPVDAHLRRPWVDWLHTAKDQASIIRDYIKWDDQPASPESAVEAIYRANQISRTHPLGPTYIVLDAALQEAELTRDVDVLPDLRGNALRVLRQLGLGDHEFAFPLVELLRVFANGGLAVLLDLGQHFGDHLLRGGGFGLGGLARFLQVGCHGWVVKKEWLSGSCPLTCRRRAGGRS